MGNLPSKLVRICRIADTLTRYPGMKFSSLIGHCAVSLSQDEMETKVLEYMRLGWEVSWGVSGAGLRVGSRFRLVGLNFGLLGRVSAVLMACLYHQEHLRTFRQDQTPAT